MVLYKKTNNQGYKVEKNSESFKKEESKTIRPSSLHDQLNATNGAGYF